MVSCSKLHAHMQAKPCRNVFILKNKAGHRNELADCIFISKMNLSIALLDHGCLYPKMFIRSESKNAFAALESLAEKSARGVIGLPYLIHA